MQATELKFLKKIGGQVYKNPLHDIVHIEFNNIDFVISGEKFKDFAQKIFKINYKDNYNKNSKSSRKYQIQMGIKGLRLVFNQMELDEFKVLLWTYLYSPIVKDEFNFDGNDFDLYFN